MSEPQSPLTPITPITPPTALPDPAASGTSSTPPPPPLQVVTTTHDGAPSPSSTSSSPSNKRTADGNADMSELVRQAKASKLASTSSKPQDEDDLNDCLEKELTCAICAEIWLDPVLCLPCSHIFCGSCIARWLENHSSCPSCRTKVANCTPNRNALGLIETLLRANPSKQRTDDDIKACKEIYDWSKKIEICQYGDEGDDEDEEEEEEEELLPWNPCPCCPPDNNTGYVCPQPITNRTLLPDYVANYLGHARCTFCERMLPTQWKENFLCDCCGQTYCGAMFDCAGKSAGQDYIQKFPDQVFCTIDSHPRQGGYALQFTKTEHDRLDKYLSDNSMTWIEVGDKVRDYLVEQNVIDRNTNRPTSELRICKSCAYSRFHRELLNWWIWHKEQSDYDVGKPKCWYGFRCRTQHSNANHAARLDHACNEIPQAQRVNNAPPRESVDIPHPATASANSGASPP